MEKLTSFMNNQPQFRVFRLKSTNVASVYIGLLLETGRSFTVQCFTSGRVDVSVDCHEHELSADEFPKTSWLVQ